MHPRRLFGISSINRIIANRLGYFSRYPSRKNGAWKVPTNGGWRRSRWTDSNGWNLKKEPVEKENHSPNLHFSGSKCINMLIFQGVGCFFLICCSFLLSFKQMKHGLFLFFPYFEKLPFDKSKKSHKDVIRQCIQGQFGMRDATSINVIRVCIVRSMLCPVFLPILSIYVNS